jgi:phosphoribosyl-ATP pyrophosphohydrolase
MPTADAELQRLFDLVKERKNTPDLPKSYTVSLFKKGRARIAQKLGEEAVETVIAAMKGDRAELVNEISDLIFHLFVLMADTNVELEDIIIELQKRRMKRDNDRE